MVKSKNKEKVLVKEKNRTLERREGKQLGGGGGADKSRKQDCKG